MAGVLDSTYLSMTELARRLDLPESTMRYYCKRFERFLPYKGEGRRRRYSPETEKTLVFIANAMHRNKNATAVELMLQSGQFTAGLTLAQGTALDVLPHIPALREPQLQAAPVISAESGQLLINIMERQAEALSKIADSLGSFVNHLASQPAPATATPTLAALQPAGNMPALAQANAAGNMPALAQANAAGANEGLRQELLDLKQQMFTAEQVHQEDLDQLRKWLGHMGEAVAKLNG